MKRSTKPCYAGDNACVRLTISEGRYHQVKLCRSRQSRVELHRERIGAITLDENLAPGEYRPFEEEIASVG